MRKFVDTLIILAFIWVVAFLGCNTTTEREPRDDSHFERYDWMERLHWSNLRSSTDDELDLEIDYNDIWYVKDPRTGLCFAFYLDRPLGKVPCGFAEDAIEE